MSKNNSTSTSTEAPKCPISRQDFAASAQGVEVTIGGQTMLAEAREFSTGSLGWYSNGKLVFKVNGIPCKVQVGITLTLVGSKELPAQ